MSTPAAIEPIVATDDERAGLASIERTLEGRGRARLIGPNNEQMIIPESLYSVLREAARQLSEGNGISILPVTQELTTQQAADLLNVSRPFVVRLLDSHEIPHHMVGTHRRVYLRDLLAYKHQRDQRTRTAIERLGNDAQDLGIYDK
jgi:excisionase family DNA binding protein